MARDDDDEDRDDEDREDEELDISSKRSRKPNDSDRQMAMFCHLGGIIGGIILPLVIWLTQKDKSRFVDRHGKEAVNFAITMIIFHLTVGMITCGCGTLVMFPIQIVFHVQAGMAASRGEWYEYPMCFHFIK